MGCSAFLITLLICFTNLLFLKLIEAGNGGFSVDLIQRDSPLSPFYDPSKTHTDRLHNAFLRSMSRMNHFRTVISASTQSLGAPASTKSLEAPVVLSRGEYLMNISIGTPQIELIGLADTGSDLTWIQCEPCEQCYTQKPPIFDPRESSTYETVACKTQFCTALDPFQTCDVKRNVCGYSYLYADQSFTEGELAVENFAFGSSTSSRPVTVPNIVFGCGHNNSGIYDEAGSGIIGLGGGPLSLVSQLDSSVKGIFSYCLVDASSESNVTSKINFGPDALVSGPEVVSTPLVDKEPATYYWVTLEAISVGSERLDYNQGAIEEGNIIIDSGTTFTFLGEELFDKLATALEKAIGPSVSDPRALYGTCYKAKNDSGLPVITFHFTGGDMKLQPLNTFDRVDEDVVCLTVASTDDSLAILGNLSQMNFLIGYDLKERTVSFKQTDCSKQ